jgi:hypothetical protein
MRLARCGIAVLCAAALFLASSPASAQTTPTSTIFQLKILGKAHSKYRYFHGALWLTIDKAERNYRWGGLHCDDNSLTEGQVKMLHDAFRGKSRVQLDYVERVYKDNRYRCITGFSIRH